METQTKWKATAITLGIISSLGFLIWGVPSLLHLMTPHASGAPPMQEVHIQSIKEERLPFYKELQGRTSPYRIAEVRPQVAGIIRERFFTEGSSVKVGDPLYLIDDELMKAALHEAEAAVCQTEATFLAARVTEERMKELVLVGAVSQQDYDNAQTALFTAKAHHAENVALAQTAKINLQYCHINAPIEGRTGRSFVTEGALVTANQADPLTVIQQMDPIYVDLCQPIDEVMRMRALFEATPAAGEEPVVDIFLRNGEEHYPHPGKLLFSEITVNQETDTVTVRALVPNPKGELLPGLFVRAKVLQGVKEKAILIPFHAVMRKPDGSSVVWMVGENNVVVEKKVVLSQAVGQEWLVDQGLAVGESIIVDNLQKIKPGASVKAIFSAPVIASPSASATH